MVTQRTLTYVAKRFKSGKQTLMKPETVHARVLYDDDRILVYNKPNKKAVHGGPGVGKTILQQLEEANISPIYPVHRLDRDTTGALIFAKDREMAAYLSGLMRHNKILRSYLALCIGVPSPLRGEVDGLLGHYKRDGRHVMGMTKRLTNNTRDTRTKYRVLKTYADALSMVELQPISGAKHQLKVHCAQLLHTPIFGDLKYAPKAMLHADLAQRFLSRGMGYQPLHLHAHKILFPEYKQTNDLIVTAPLPNFFLASLMRIESYNFHRTRTTPKKDKLLDSVDEKLLQNLTGLGARQSFYEVDATIPEEEQQLQDLSYEEEQRYSYATRQRQQGRWKRNIKLDTTMRNTVSRHSDK